MRWQSWQSWQSWQMTVLDLTIENVYFALRNTLHVYLLKSAHWVDNCNEWDLVGGKKPDCSNMVWWPEGEAE
jgi:hypothetical protein